MVGAGKTAAEKIPRLLGCGAIVSVVAPAGTSKIQTWARAGKLSWIQRRFEPQDLHEIFLCVVATSSEVVNQVVYEEARQRGILCNVVHDGTHSNFYYPAVVERGPLQIAISTAGQAGPSRGACGKSSKANSAPNGRAGFAGSQKPGVLCMTIPYRREKDELSCASAQACRSQGSGRVFSPLGITGQGKPRAK